MCRNTDSGRFSGVTDTDRTRSACARTNAAPSSGSLPMSRTRGRKGLLAKQIRRASRQAAVTQIVRGLTARPCFKSQRADAIKRFPGETPRGGAPGHTSLNCACVISDRNKFSLSFFLWNAISRGSPTLCSPASSTIPRRPRRGNGHSERAWASQYSSTPSTGVVDGSARAVSL